MIGSNASLPLWLVRFEFMKSLIGLNRANGISDDSNFVLKILLCHYCKTERGDMIGWNRVNAISDWTILITYYTISLKEQAWLVEKKEIMYCDWSILI